MTEIRIPGYVMTVGGIMHYWYDESCQPLGAVSRGSLPGAREIIYADRTDRQGQYAIMYDPATVKRV